MTSEKLDPGFSLGLLKIYLCQPRITVLLKLIERSLWNLLRSCSSNHNKIKNKKKFNKIRNNWIQVCKAHKVQLTKDRWQSFVNKKLFFLYLFLLSTIFLSKQIQTNIKDKFVCGLYAFIKWHFCKQNNKNQNLGPMGQIFKILNMNP